MTYKNERCPRCGNVARGELAPNGGRDFANWAGKEMAHSGVESAVDSFGVGPILGGILYAVGEMAADSAVDAATSNIGEAFAFECPNCGHRWVSNGRPPMPPQIIAQVREEYLNELRDKPTAVARVFGILAGAFTFIFCICCMMSSKDDVGFWEISKWAVYGFMFFALATVFGIIAIVKGKKAAWMTREERACANQDLSQFKEAHPQLFKNYSQYS